MLHNAVAEFVFNVPFVGAAQEIVPVFGLLHFLTLDMVHTMLAIWWIIFVPNESNEEDK